MSTHINIHHIVDSVAFVFRFNMSKTTAAAVTLRTKRDHLCTRLKQFDTVTNSDMVLFVFSGEKFDIAIEEMPLTCAYTYIYEVKIVLKNLVHELALDLGYRQVLPWSDLVQI